VRVLGLSAFYHDSAAALVEDGRILAAAQEERFTRVKHDPGFPGHALRYCLEAGGGGPIDQVVFYEKPFLKFERLIETYLAFAPKGFNSFRKAMPLWIGEKLFQRDLLVKELKAIDPALAAKEKMRFAEHHFSHAASAYFPSPYEEAVVLTMDGVGEWATTSLAVGRGDDLKIEREIFFPHSLGLLYSAFTYYTGFKVNSGEYKVMGLAPYGEPRFAQTILDKLIDLKPDGSFKLDLDYFDYCTGFTMTNGKFDALFGGPPRQGEQLLDQKHMDLAASIQAVTEEVILRLTRSVAKTSGVKNLCLAGGVALNCVANGKILRDGHFENIYIQPAAGDAGGALGAALTGYYDGKPGRMVNGHDSMQGSYLGPAYDDAETERRLTAAKAVCTRLDDDALVEAVAQALADGKAIGWHQGRMEFGPRALGNRSILGDPRSPTMQKILNLKVKYRESFRPFAPAVLREDVSDWFEIETDSPYMLLVANVKPEHCIAMSADEQKLFGIDKLNVARSSIPAVTHVDYSARISRFKALTGCPILVNTSFNVRGEPIVATPEDAFRCFMGCDIDVLAVGNCLMLKADQDPALAKDYKDAFALD
jgi:carbamoyltransferase